MLFIFSIVFVITEALFWLAMVTQFGNTLLVNVVFGILALISPVCLVYFRRHFGITVYNSYRIPFYAFGLLVTTGLPKLVASIFTLLYFAVHSLFYWGTDHIILSIGWFFAAYLFVALIYAIVWGRFKFKVKKVNLAFDNLPQELDGMSFVQISDIHIGSFFDNYKPVEKAIKMINDLEVDYLFFTGDLVNNYAEEMEGWVPILEKIKVKKSKYSILGNHDYGDYVNWADEALQDKNLERIIDYHKQIGFEPLLNKKVKLTAGEEETAFLIGVENWGAPPFKQYGDLRKAMQDTNAKEFQILLSHDPSHFDLEVVKDSDVELTLSGHTHGGQIGLNRWGMKASFVKLKYKKWAGLYKSGKQYLYVNQGFGYIGFPGRLGIYPEITHFTLNKKK